MTQTSTPKVSRGAYVATVGFDVTGKLIRDKYLSFSEFLKIIEGSRMSDVVHSGNSQIHIGELLPDWAINFPIDKCTNYIHEYYSKGSIDSTGHDEFLLRLFARKRSLLASRGNSGLNTIKLFELDMIDLQAPVPTLRDEGANDHKRLVLSESKVSGFEDVTP